MTKVKNLKFYRTALALVATGIIMGSLSGCSEPKMSNKHVAAEEQEMSQTSSSEEVNEGQVLQYLEDWRNTMDGYLSSDNLDSVKDKIADGFITMTDFVFYGAPISFGDKSITFKQLPAALQEKFELVKVSTDMKIESHFPNYKEYAAEKAGDIKYKAEELTASLQQKLAGKIDEYITPEGQAKADKYWNMFIDQTKDTLEKGGELYQGTKEILQNNETLQKWGAKVIEGKDTVTQKADEWYQEFKAKHK